MLKGHLRNAATRSRFECVHGTCRKPKSHTNHYFSPLNNPADLLDPRRPFLLFFWCLHKNTQPVPKAFCHRTLACDCRAAIPAPSLHVDTGVITTLHLEQTRMICCNHATAPGSLAAYYCCQAVRGRLALNAPLETHSGVLFVQRTRFSAVCFPPHKKATVCEYSARLAALWVRRRDLVHATLMGDGCRSLLQ